MPDLEKILNSFFLPERDSPVGEKQGSVITLDQVRYLHPKLLRPMSYLSCRNQVVKVKVFTSCSRAVIGGTIQSSASGRVLCLFHVNDIFNVVPDSVPFPLVHDIKIVYNFESNDLDFIVAAITKDQVSLNIRPNKHMIKVSEKVYGF